MANPIEDTQSDDIDTPINFETLRRTSDMHNEILRDYGS